jgi:glycosyltransferase involved in cell wall biosynthesis
MPCHNVAATIDETRQSLVEQTHSNFEIVAVDDGSTDNSLELLQAWAQRDKRVRVLARPHAGIIEALNNGLQSCQGDYIARMDADDLAHPQRLEKQAAFLDSHPDVAVASCLIEGFPKDELREGYRIYIDWLNSLVSHEDIMRELFVESPLAHPSAMLRRDVFLEAGGYQEHGWPEDYDLWLHLAQSGQRFAKVPEVLLSWRDHPNRLTRTDSRYSVSNFLRAKAFYLMKGPLQSKDALFIWGAGMMGKRLSKHLLDLGAPLELFVDVDPVKIGRTRRDRPIIAVGDLMEHWQRYEQPVLLAAVGARGARRQIKDALTELGLIEGKDWWAAA